MSKWEATNVSNTNIEKDEKEKLATLISDLNSYDNYSKEVNLAPLPQEEIPSSRFNVVSEGHEFIDAANHAWFAEDKETGFWLRDRSEEGARERIEVLYSTVQHMQSEQTYDSWFTKIDELRQSGQSSNDIAADPANDPRQRLKEKAMGKEISGINNQASEKKTGEPQSRLAQIRAMSAEKSGEPKKEEKTVQKSSRSER